MMAAPSRRAALGTILTAPLTAVPAVAASTISPALARIIAEHDAYPATKNEWPDSVWPTEAERKEAGRLRALVAGYPSAGWPDTTAKAACLARLWPAAEAEDEVRSECGGGHAYLECMAFAIACEVMRLGGKTSCA